MDTHSEEDERVFKWRKRQLMMAGYDEHTAQVVSERLDIDLHLATDLMENGCPLKEAIAILL